MKRIKPERIKGIKIGGVVTDVKENKWFTFDIKPKNRDFSNVSLERYRKAKNWVDMFIIKPIAGLRACNKL